MLERIHKVLANAGVASRRACEELITTGRVTVDGKVVTELGSKIDPGAVDLRVDGERVRPPTPCYLLLNKPRGVVSTAEERPGVRNVIDFVPPAAGRVFSVGRLDKDSEGLLLLTNDGALCQRLTHPRHGVHKVYRVTTQGKLPRDCLDMLREGVWLSAGKARVESARIIKHGRQHSTIELVLGQGVNRQIRRMLAKTGVKVKRLVRTGIGPLKLGRLRTGTLRPLTREELRLLFTAAGLEQTRRRPAGDNPARSGGRR